MCGIVGYFGRRIPEIRGALERAADAIRHRGPDDGGFWFDEAAGLALAHRRLSIIDLSAAGHQPMLSHDGRWVISFNGEIYNHRELRRRLEAQSVGGTGAWRAGTSADLPSTPVWHGHSDTETLLECISHWGIERALDAATGMFALALWDRQERRLHLARDRMGEKPLYYGWIGGGFAFASELKALRALPGFHGEIDRRALAQFMQHSLVPAPCSIYSGILKLIPGTVLNVSAHDVECRRLTPPRPYWRLLDVAQQGHAEPLRFASDTAAADALESVLSAAVGSQMLADVPLGAFLSGGVDSSTIVALMQAQSERPVKTFSIGFLEHEYNEAEHAKAVARHLGTDHTELYVDDATARSVIPALPSMYCEPFADSSQIPTYLVSKLARQSVAVSLSGDGGDELFGGYTRYFAAARIWSSLQRVPAVMRQTLASAIRAVSPQRWDLAFQAAAPLVPVRYRGRFPGEKLHRTAEFLLSRTFGQFYRDGFVSYWHPGIVVGINGDERPRVTDDLQGFELIERMMIEDSLNYLPDDILVKVDRAAMSVSLEARVPMLDRNVVEFAWRLPTEYKIRDGKGKWLLRQVLGRHVPSTLFERPKMGFGVPIDAWLRGPMREWAADLLDGQRLRREGFLDPGPIGQRWREHQSGLRNWHHHLWNVLMFEAWLDAGR